MQTQVDELLPLKNKLDELRKRVKEFRRAINDVLNNDEDMDLIIALPSTVANADELIEDQVDVEESIEKAKDDKETAEQENSPTKEPVEESIDKVAKYYMDALYAKRSMKTGDTEERRESAEVQFDIATQEAWTALAAIERYIFDK